MTMAVRIQNLDTVRDLKIEIHDKDADGKVMRVSESGILHPEEHTIIYLNSGRDYHLIEI